MQKSSISPDIDSTEQCKGNESKNGKAKKSPPNINNETFEGKPSLQNFEHLRITELTDIPHTAPVISVNGEIIASAGNIVTLSGPSKSGKSALICYFIAASLTEYVQDPIPTITVSYNRSCKAIIQFDTEQSLFSHQRNYKAILRRAGLESSPDYLLSYNIRSILLEEYCETTSTICKEAAEKCGGIHMLLIDGVADYISDVNNMRESRNIVSFFMKLSTQYNCPVIVIIHTNPINGKAQYDPKERGNLGSEIQRKSESLLTITNQNDVLTLSAKMLRSAGKEDFTPISLKYDKQKGYHVFNESDKSTKTKEKAETRRAELVDIAIKVFGNLNSYKYGEAIALVMKVTGLKERTAKDILKELKAHGLVIEHDDDKRWRKNAAANY